MADTSSVESYEGLDDPPQGDKKQKPAKAEKEEEEAIGATDSESEKQTQKAKGKEKTKPKQKKAEKKDSEDEEKVPKNKEKEKQKGLESDSDNKEEEKVNEKEEEKVPKTKQQKGKEKETLEISSESEKKPKQKEKQSNKPVKGQKGKKKVGEKSKNDKNSEETKKTVKLEELEVIVVENSQSEISDVEDDKDDERKDTETFNDDDNPGGTGVLTKPKKPRAGFFDRLPDETVTNIFAYLSEVELVKAGQVCKRFYSFLNEDIVWEPKIKNWVISVKVPDNLKTPYKDFYVAKYKENKNKVEADERARITNEKITRRRERKEAIVTTVMQTYFRFHGTEIPVFVLLSLWSLLLALRADEFITCSYHLVFLPVYIALLHILCCLLVGDFLNWWFTEIGESHTWDRKNLPSVLTREFNSCSRGRLMLYCTWFCYFLWMLFIAIAEDDIASENGGIFTSWWALLPLFLAICLYGIGWCTKSWYDSCDRFLFIIVIILPWLVFMWIVLFTWAKAEEVTTFSWWVAFSPWWIIAIGVFFPLSTAWIFITFNIVGGTERMVALRVAVPVTIGLVSLSTWFILMAYNQERYIRDLSIWPWTLVSVPLFAGEIGLTACLAYFAMLIH